MNEPDAKVALVTGGSRGVGRAIALRLAQEGFHIAITYRRRVDEANAVVARIREQGFRAQCYQHDASQPDEAGGLVARVLADFGHVNALVHNAGEAGRGHLVAETTPDEARRLFDVHVVSPMHITSRLLPSMRRLPRADIVMISSAITAKAMRGGATYMMAKAALEALCQTLALEEKAHHIRVNCVAPGITRTDMGDRFAAAVTGTDAESASAAMPFGRFVEPPDVAGLVAFLVSAETMMVTGQRIILDGGQEVPGL